MFVIYARRTMFQLFLFFPSLYLTFSLFVSSIAIVSPLPSSLSLYFPIYILTLFEGLSRSRADDCADSVLSARTRSVGMQQTNTIEMRIGGESDLL